MKITQELIERYHRNECTAAERGWVEEWLFSAESDDELVLPAGENKADHKSDIWESLQAEIPALAEEAAPTSVYPQQTALQKNSGKDFTSLFTLPQLAFAAILIAAVFTLILYRLPLTPQPEELMVDNTTTFVKHYDSKGYAIAVGPNTAAKIDYKTGMIDFSGSLMISPKKDIELVFYGDDEKVTFKMGQTYIILKDKNEAAGMIVINERNLPDLPPLIQKHIFNQFSI